MKAPTRPPKAPRPAADAQPAPRGSLQGVGRKLAALVGRRKPTLLLGPTGCGKTTAVEFVAASLGLTLHTAIASGDMTPADLAGRWHLGPAGSEWRDGALTRAVTLGGVFYLDELTLIGDDVQKLLYPLLDHRRELVLNARDGQRLRAHPDFAFVGSYNPPSRFPAHFRQRCAFLEVAYLDAADEADLLVARAGVPRPDAEFLVRVGELTRTRLADTLGDGAGTRLLLAAADEMAHGAGREEAVESLLLALCEDRPARLSALTTLQAAGLYSVESLRALRLRAGERAELPAADDAFLDREAPADPGDAREDPDDR